jgi:tetratricopeptide (TPR) repeat protein
MKRMDCKRLMVVRELRMSIEGKTWKLVWGLTLAGLLSIVVSCAGAYHYAQGVSLSQKGQYEEAVTKLTDAIRENPESALAHYQRGFAHLALGSHAVAIYDFNTALSLNKSGFLERYSLLHLCYYNRGVSYHATGKTAEAIADYTSALAIKRDFAEAYANRGKAYGDLGDRERALADLRKAIETNPTYREKIGPMIEQLERK